MEENLGMKGRVMFEVLDANGNLKDFREVNNTVTAAGKALIAGLALNDLGTGSVGLAFDYIGLGTGNTAPSTANTTLVAEVYRTTSTGTRVTTTVPNDTSQLSGSFNITNSVTVAESGIFNSASSGTMWARTTFSGIPVNSGDTINAVWKVSFA